MTSSTILDVAGVTKHFGETVALGGVDLAVEQGTIFGLLGPNGAGKTTLVRILATLLLPDAGTATVAGFDVRREPVAVRSVIGLAGQFAAVDETLTGRENLEVVGRLYRLPAAEAKRRAAEALERLTLADAADRPVRTYSGGMRRRLDLGASLVGRPRVLLLDEPTTGLDPRTRLELWDFLVELVDDGTTIVLTTQYLEEADKLAKEIVVIDRGLVIARGTSDELKARIGADVLEIKVADRTELDRAAATVAGLSVDRPQLEHADGLMTIPVSGGGQTLMAALRALDDEHIAVADIALRRPSLDDVFLTLTGHHSEETPADPVPPSGRKGRAARSAA